MKTYPAKLFFTVMLFSFFIPSLSFACTSIIVSKGASKTGSPIITYSCDGEFHPILSLFPAADHQPGEMLELSNWYGQKYSIKQVEHTYRVVGLMNEYQVAIGESTWDGRPELENTKGSFDYYTLMLIALQRSKTAREAIDVMTSLVDEYGYASTGESFSIADKEEAWIMEMIGPGEGGKGAIWVAIKIPDDYISAHANMSRIHGFPLNDPENCIYSENVISFATEKGYYNPANGKSFSFSDAYNPPTEEQIRYSARRVWSIFRRVSPSLNLSPAYSDNEKDAQPYPLYIKADRKLDVQDVIALHRDHYEGTEFDMTKDLAAGPFGAPDKWRPIKWEIDENKYAWERPIATQQAAFVFAAEPRADLPNEIGGIYWYGLDNPYTNFFAPFYTSISSLPKSYTVGKLNKFTRESAWWAFNFVANYANLRWSYMIQDIQKVQKEIEDDFFSRQSEVETEARNLLKENSAEVEKYLTSYCVESAETGIQKWWELGDLLITKYNDGYIQNENGRPQEIGYPESWLQTIPKEKLEKYRLKQERNGKGEL